MANFPNLPNQAPVPSAALGFPPPPLTAQALPRIGGPRVVSFSQPTDQGAMTIDALMAREKELALRQAQASQGDYPGAGTVLGGIGNAINQFTAAFGRARAE